jgi:hypothetical protein
VWLGGPGDKGTTTLGPFRFDAKIEAQADPIATTDEPTPRAELQTTAAGCLEKTLEALAAPAGHTPDNTIGLNEILIVGTATWNAIVPEILFP